MTRKCISQVEGGAPAIGPYSPVVVAEGRFAFVSGQVPFDPEAGGIVRGSIAEQTELVLRNLERAVRAAGGSLGDVVSCRVYLQPLNAETFREMNGVYEKYFGSCKPARATVGAGLLNFDVEIEAVALVR